MAKVIRCQCGFLARGETVEQAAAAIDVHMRSDHPELVGKVTREDLIAMFASARQARGVRGRAHPGSRVRGLGARLR
jgi:hypothetical protein